MFIGRKEYLDSLGMLWNKTGASLVTCRGRRRIGKSTLIEEFAACTTDHFIEIEGLPPPTVRYERRLSMRRAFGRRSGGWLLRFHRSGREAVAGFSVRRP